MIRSDDVVSAVAHTDKYGHIIFLRLLDGKGLYLPVYIGKTSRTKSLVITKAAGRIACSRQQHSDNPWPVLSSFRPMFRPCSCAKSHSCLPAGDSESSALEKELHQKQSVGISPSCMVDRGMTLLTMHERRNHLRIHVQARPMTHDFMKMALETLGYRVSLA